MNSSKPATQFIESPPCPACGGLVPFTRVTHSGGFHIRAWCIACQRDAEPKRVWWPQHLFPLEQRARLKELSPERPVSTSQLGLFGCPTNDNGAKQ